MNLYATRVLAVVDSLQIQVTRANIRLEGPNFYNHVLVYQHQMRLQCLTFKKFTYNY